MSDDQWPRAEPGAGAGPDPDPASPVIRLVSPLNDERADEDMGGDAVCWAHLVCEECGAITTEGHRAGCSPA
jgi:hypothetical protein